MSDDVRIALSSGRDSTLIDLLLVAHQEVKRNFFLGGHRLQAVEGGRFCEAAFRLLEEATTGRFTPLGRSLDIGRLMGDLARSSRGSHPDAVRLHIPRALRVVYDVRNNRDIAHLGAGIDPNLQDATLVVGVVDWVLAEFVRLWHNPSVSADTAQRIVADLVTRRVPVVEDFDGYLKVLDPHMSQTDHLLLLIYHRGARGAMRSDLRRWATPQMRKNMTRLYDKLEHDMRYIHCGDDVVLITKRGVAYVEQSGLITPGRPR